jgi:molybdopterin-guanine dinucleotide biosynthesis protein A
MGTNKALLRARPDGPTVVEEVVARLTDAGVHPNLLVTNTPHKYTFLNLPVVPDDIPGAGPLGGILTALHHSSSERVLVVACDMPLLNPHLIRYMLSLPGDYDALVPRWTNEAGDVAIETLHAIYSRRCTEAIYKRIAAGRLKLHELLQDVAVRYLHDAELRRYDPHLQSFRNVNTPEEWASLINGE